ncbi:MAG: hypothetical protein K0M45_06910 [Candidatus Paracaedibacteraceae bacterium]|nr:hypothetical protein [Candidatus Paracaedibacteraceae bacterium]
MEESAIQKEKCVALYLLYQYRVVAMSKKEQHFEILQEESDCYNKNSALMAYRIQLTLTEDFVFIEKRFKQRELTRQKAKYNCF